MKKAVSILKVCAIILNLLFAIFLTLAMIQNRPGGAIRIMFLAVLICSVLNVILLALSKQLLTGGEGGVFLCLSSVLNIGSLICVIYGFARWGMPPNLIAAIAIILWSAFPVVTVPAIFLVRGQLKKKPDSD